MADLIVEIGAVTDGLNKGLKDAESKLQSFGANLQKLGGALSLAVTVPLLAIGTASVKAASDAEETSSKFDVVFKDIAKSAQESFELLRKEYGLSSTAAKQLLGDTGDLLTGFGFSQEAALDLSTQVNKLAVDLASFTNFSGGAEGASKALTSALLGEREAAKSLGIAILEEDVNKQVAINTAKGLTFETERQAKAYATLDIALSQSKNALGDYARTSESFANQSRLLSARLSELGVSIGEVLLPFATKLSGFLLKLVEGFNSLDGTTKKIIVGIGILVAAIGPLLLGIGTIIQLLPVLGVAFAALTGPIGLTVAAISAAAILIITNFDEIKRSLSFLTLEIVAFAQDAIRAFSIFGDLIPSININLKTADLILQSIGERVAKSITQGLGTDGVKGIDEFNKALSETVIVAKSAGDAISGITRTDSTSVPTATNERNPFSGGLPALESLQGIDLNGGFIASFFDQVDNVLAERIPMVVEQFAFLASEINGILEFGIENTLGDFAFSIGEALGSGANVIKAGGAALLGGLASVLNQLGQLAIGTGIAIAGIKKALLTLNPAVAIGAGVALIALAGFVSSKAKSLGNFGSGGSSAGGDSGVGGGQASNFSGGSTAGNFDPNRNLKLETVISGTDLRFVLTQSDPYRN